MYPLLPLQVFKLRYSLESFKIKEGDHKKKQIEIIYEARRIVEVISREARKLFDDKEITGDDFHRILIANANLFEYLNNKYGRLKGLNEEVEKVTKTLYDPAVEERGRKKGEKIGEMKKAIETAKLALKEGASVEFVAKITGLEIDKVEELQKEIKNL